MSIYIIFVNFGGLIMAFIKLSMVFIVFLLPIALGFSIISGCIQQAFENRKAKKIKNEWRNGLEIVNL
jgi:autotransporter translocation and assembly factor TamB